MIFFLRLEYYSIKSLKDQLKSAAKNKNENE